MCWPGVRRELCAIAISHLIGYRVHIETQVAYWQYSDKLHTFWSGEMQHISILSEHVNFLYTRNRLYIQFLQSALKFFVILCRRRLSFPHDLAAHSPLPAFIARII